MLELVEKIRMREDWQGIANAAYKQNGRLMANDLRPLASNLDELPVIDFSREDEFHLKEGEFIQADMAYDATEPIMFTGSRGCAFHCN